MFWRMHLAVEEPDLPQLRELHRALCHQETLLCERHLDRCMQNLVQRLQEARSLGMQLSIPAWVTTQLRTSTVVRRRRTVRGGAAMKRAAIYLRVTTVDQNAADPAARSRSHGPAAWLRDRTALYRSDHWHSCPSSRSGPDDGRCPPRQFDIVLVWACDRLARCVRHFLEVLDELNHLGIEFVSFREQLDTAGPLGRAVVVIIGAIAELETQLIVERVRAGMRRAKLEGRHIGRRPLNVDRAAVLRDRQRGLSLTEVAKAPPYQPGLGHRRSSAMPETNRATKGSRQRPSTQ